MIVETKGMRINTTGAEWRKSVRSDNSGGNCVEVAFIDAAVCVRDSKDPDSILVYNHAEWEAFIGGIKAGEFDH